MQESGKGNVFTIQKLRKVTLPPTPCPPLCVIDLIEIDLIVLPLGNTNKKVFFLVVVPLRFYPPYAYSNGLVVHATFFFFF